MIDSKGGCLGAIVLSLLGLFFFSYVVEWVVKIAN